MLSPPDADLVAREPGLPGLATALDPEAFVEALQSEAPDARLRDSRVTYLRYRPDTFCLVAYRVQADGRPVDVYGIAHRPDAATKLRNARTKGQLVGPLGIGRFVLEDRALVVSFFPNDRRLRILPALADPDARQRLLRKVLPKREDLWKATVETVRYRPERRFSTKLVAKGRPRAIVKVYGPEDYGFAARGAKALHSNPPLRVQRRIAKSRGRRLLVFKWMEGRLLEEALVDRRLEPEAFGRVGQALAALHAQEAPDLPIRTRHAEAASLLHVAADLGYLWPPLAKRTWDLARDLAGRILEGPDAAAPIHGDFQAEHVLLAEDEVRVVDLDEVGRGDPAIDLGNFLAHLELDALRGLADGGRIGAFTDAFLAGYGWADRDRAALATAAGLLRLAIEPFRDRDPDWPRTMEAILSRAEEFARLRTTMEAAP